MIDITATRRTITGETINERLRNFKIAILETARNLITGMGLVRVDSNGNHPRLAYGDRNQAFECFTYPMYQEHPDLAPFYLTVCLRVTSWNTSSDYMGDVNIGITTRRYSDANDTSATMAQSAYYGFSYKYINDTIEYADKTAILRNEGNFAMFAYERSKARTPIKKQWSWGVVPIRLSDSGGNMQIVKLHGSTSESMVFGDDGRIYYLPYGYTNNTANPSTGDKLFTVPIGVYLPENGVTISSINPNAIRSMKYNSDIGSLYESQKITVDRKQCIAYGDRLVFV